MSGTNTNISVEVGTGQPVSVTIANNNVSAKVGDGQPISVSFPSTNAGQLLLNDIVDQETPTPATDGSTTLFSVANAYRAGTLKLYRDQAKLIRDIDYTETDPGAGQFTMTIAPDSNEGLRADYIKQ